MKKLTHTIYLGGAFTRFYARKWTFLVVFLVLFFLLHVLLTAAGLSPVSVKNRENVSRPPQVEQTSNTEDLPKVTLPAGGGEIPVRIEIPTLGIRALVVNPTSANIATLDQALLAGTVRYPGSGIPGEEGNVLIFGHSSHLPVVYNQAFKAFNEIQELERGDRIILYGETNVFLYEVEKVEEANASTDAIPLAVSGAYLTLATCNNFGTKQDRFIVTAKLVEVTTLE
ncbi:MAG: sortase [Minisyncoccia bacterium]